MMSSPITAARAEGECVTDNRGIALHDNGKPCVPRVGTTPQQAELIEAKENFARVYASYSPGDASTQDVNSAKARLEALTGDSLPFPSPNRIAEPPEGSALAGLSNYWPFQQKDGDYCGPATAQSMLWYLGNINSQYAPGGESLTGNIFDDQWALGRSYYLDTNNDLQTAWHDGTFVFRKTLNRWRIGSDTGFYIQSSVSGVPGEGTTLTESGALNNIKSDIDMGYPVAQNVIYNSETYWPPDFPQSGTFKHWDNVYGHFVSGSQYVQIAQVYPAYPSSRPNMFYNRLWSGNGGAWDAINNWYGIAW